MKEKLCGSIIRYKWVWIFTLSILIVCIPMYFDANLMEVYALLNWKNPENAHWWSWFTYTFAHGIYFSEPSEEHWFIFVHMGTNLSVLYLFGVPIERKLGTGQMLLLSLVAYIVATTFFAIDRQVVFFYQVSSVVGASGIMYAYIPSGAYLRMKKVKESGVSLWKHPWTWVMVFGFLYYYIFISVISGPWTAVAHVLATIVGAIYALAMRKRLREQMRVGSQWYFLLLVIPVFLLGLLLAYKLGMIPIYMKWI